MGKDWVEDWLDPDDELKEVEVDPDVFYDYFLSIPTVKCQRLFKQYKTQFLAKIKDGKAEEIAQDLGIPNNQEAIKDLKEMKDEYDQWKVEKGKWVEAKKKRPFNSGETDEEKKLKKAVRDREKGLTGGIKEYFKDKV